MRKQGAGARGRRIWVILLGLLALAVFLWWGKQNWRPAEDVYPDQGFELSSEDGVVNWALTRGDGADFVYLVASWGSDGRSTRFEADWHAAHKVGLRRGAVHNYSLCRLAQDQATNFIAMVPRDEAALPPALALDLGEECAARPDRSVVLKELATFIKMVEAHIGKLVVVKVSKAFDTEYRLSRALDRPLWLSSLFFLPAYGERPWVMWQANDARILDGVDHRVPWIAVRP